MSKNKLRTFATQIYTATMTNLVRSIAHEIGHTLGLHHPWGDDQADQYDIHNVQGLGPVGKPEIYY